MTTPMKAPLWGSSRLAQSLMNMVAFTVTGLIAISMSLSMVCMVRKPNSSNDSQPINDSMRTSRDVDTTTWSLLQTSDHCSQSSTNISTEKPKHMGEFEWTRSFQGFVLSSFFYGCMTTILLGGFLAGRFGGKHVIGVGLLVSSICTVLIPSAVRLNKYAIIVLRVITGIALGPTTTVVVTLGGQWYPPHERSFLVSLSCFGITLGNVLGFLIPAQLCTIQYDNGWPLTFYVSGVAGFISWILWNIFAHSSPRQHPRISQQEKQYLATSIGIKSSITERPPFPWVLALRTPAVWAIIGAQTSNAWFIYSALTSMPMYLKEVLHFNIKQNAVWMILPQLLTLLVNVPFGILADTIIKRDICSVVVTRRIFQLASSWISPLIVIGVAFMGHDQRYFAVGMLASITPIQTLCRSGFVANCIDIAPRYSGEIFGLSNTFATLSGVLAPIVVGISTANGTKQEWRTVFFIASAIFFGGGLIFMLFSKGVVLSWADKISNVDRIASSNPDVENPADPRPMETVLGLDVVHHKSTKS